MGLKIFYTSPDSAQNLKRVEFRLRYGSQPVFLKFDLKKIGSNEWASVLLSAIDTSTY